MRLFEIFNSPTKWQWVQGKPAGTTVATFTANNDERFEVFFTKIDGDAIAEFDPTVVDYINSGKMKNVVEVCFGLAIGKDHDRRKAHFDVTDSDGNQLQIFSTVLATVKEYIDKHNIDTVAFTSNTRQKRNVVYDNLIKRLPQFEILYRGDTGVGGWARVWILSRKR